MKTAQGHVPKQGPGPNDPLDPAQVQRLKDEFGIYMVDSSRINVAGVNGANVDYFVDAMRQVLV